MTRTLSDDLRASDLRANDLRASDLRKRVVSATLAGESCRSVAAQLGVAVSSVVKWSQRHRETGSVAPAKMGGHRKRVLWTQMAVSMATARRDRL